MIWGGLHPVRSRFILDVCTILSLSYCCYLISSFCRAGGGVDNDDDDDDTAHRNIQNIKSDSDLSSILLWKSGILFGTLITLKGQITHRWPLTFPMMCLMTMQFFRLALFWFLPSGSDNEDATMERWWWYWWWLSLGYDVASGILIFISTSLLVLFPAVKLSPPVAVGGTDGDNQQLYNVGVVDFFLPIQKEDNDGKEIVEDEFLTARLLYPTAKTNSFFETTIPHLNPSTSNMICNAMMKFAGPPPIRKLGWMLHTWCLAKIPMIRNAKPIDCLSRYVNNGDVNGCNNCDNNKKGSNDHNDIDKQNNLSEEQYKKLPLVIYSHGLFGNYVTYTYQPLSLAANGYVVLMIDHEDGSAPIMGKHDGSFLYHNLDPSKLYADGKENESVRRRRSQTKHRVSELLYAAQSLLNLNEKNIPQLQSHGISFVNKLGVIDGVTFMGHSFGGASALSAAAKRPDLTFCVIAHEPAVDWMTDDARRALFPEKKFVGTRNSYTGGTGGYEEESEEIGDAEKRREEYLRRSSSVSTSSSLANRSTLHDVDMLFLYSDQWAKQGWGGSKLVECLHQRGELGPESGASDYGVIAEACHIEFSDTAMLTPAWLGRATNNLGKRNPHDTAQEIASRTLVFLDGVKKRNVQKEPCDY